MKIIFTAIIVFFISTTFYTSAYAKDKITWLITHWPPWMILEGEDAGTGPFNHILKIAQENLPQYEHKTVKMNWARYWLDVEHGEQVCNIFAYRNPKREKIAYFSEPHIFVLSNSII